MKPIFILLLLIFSTTTASAALATPAISPVTETEPIALDRKVVEAQLGRRLNFAERIVFGIAKRKAKRRKRASERSGPVDALAVVSMGLGILTVLTTLLGSGALFIILGVGAIVTGVISLVNLSGKIDYKRGRGFAIAGIAIPIAWTGLLLLFILLLFSGFN